MGAGVPGGGIREWPLEDRPRERLYHKGAESLADAELLAIQLGTGLAGLSAMDMARELLASPEQVFERYGPLMEDLQKEVFRVALLDAQNGLLRDVVISEGTLSASLVHPREVFKPAILESAASVILLHNHPSGDPTPSREDLRLTRQLVECSRLLDLRIHDHVIIGRERFISLAQRGAL